VPLQGLELQWIGWVFGLSFKQEAGLDECPVPIHVGGILMISELPVKEPEPVSCSVCHVEIPRAESLSIEGKEYVYYFCGHGCYSRWNGGLEERVKSRGGSVDSKKR
jgi:YHS domain-containing protein